MRDGSIVDVIMITASSSIKNDPTLGQVGDIFSLTISIEKEQIFMKLIAKKFMGHRLLCR